MIGRIRAKEKARRWISRNALIADTETTGFAKHDEVVEVAVVNSLGMAVFHEFVKPTVPINSSALRVHGISERQLARCCCRDGVHDEFRRLIEGSQLVFYNASFDKRLLTQTINKFGLRVPDELTRAECAMLEYKKYSEGRPGSLSAAAEHLGVCPVGQAHNALDDCLTTLRVIETMAI